MKNPTPKSNLEIEFILPKTLSNQVKVVGIGGCGSNSVNHLHELNLENTDLVICNTDSQALDSSPVPNKFQLGAQLTYGTGAGGDPRVGKKAAEESLSELEQIAESRTKVIILTAGMGGGTGTGALPVIAKMLRNKNILTIAIVTFPFDFEGPKRLSIAKNGLKELSENFDSLLVLRNNVLKDRFGNLTMSDAFDKSDEILIKTTNCILTVLTQNFKINIDLKDLKSVLNSQGQSFIGYGESSGKNRAKKAITEALNNPLLSESFVKDVEEALLIVVSKEFDLTINEMEAITSHINTESGKKINYFIGIGSDENLKEEISITLIGSGSEKVSIQEEVNFELDKEFDIKQVFKDPYFELGLKDAFDLNFIQKKSNQNPSRDEPDTKFEEQNNELKHDLYHGEDSMEKDGDTSASEKSKLKTNSEENSNEKGVETSKNTENSEKMTPQTTPFTGKEEIDMEPLEVPELVGDTEFINEVEFVSKSDIQKEEKKSNPEDKNEYYFED